MVSKNPDTSTDWKDLCIESKEVLTNSLNELKPLKTIEVVKQDENTVLIIVKPSNTEHNGISSSSRRSIESQKTIEKCTEFSKEHRIQIGISFLATLLMLDCGLHLGWVGPSALKLSSNNSLIPLTTTEEISWLTTMLPIGGTIGPIFGSILANSVGRKTTILLLSIPSFFTWIIIFLANNLYQLYIAQFLSGLTVGAAFVVLPMYIGEISSPKIRGVLAISISVKYTFGIFLESVIVPYVSLKLNAIICLSIPLLLICTFSWMPESPYYYIIKKQPAKAAHSLRILKQNEDIDKHLEHLTQIVDQEQKEAMNMFEIFQLRNNRIAFGIVVGLMTIQEFSGANISIEYAQIILDQANAPIDAHISGIILNLFGVLFTFLGCVFIDYLGRRPLLLFSTFGSIIPLVLIGSFFHMQHYNSEYVNYFTLAPIIGLSTYKLTFSVGMGPIPFVYLSEMLSTNIKGFASTFVCCYGSGFHFITNKLYQQFCDTFGVHNAFYFFGLCCLCSGIFVYFFVPETKEKSLHEIQNELRRNPLKKTTQKYLT